jgi:hypothetical protein
MNSPPPGIYSNPGDSQTLRVLELASAFHPFLPQGTNVYGRWLTACRCRPQPMNKLAPVVTLIMLI